MEIYFFIELVKLAMPVCKVEIKNVYQQRKFKKCPDIKIVVANSMILSFLLHFVVNVSKSD